MTWKTISMMAPESSQPVFLLAPARSYSTVSLALLAGHPSLFGFPEILMFSEPTVGALLDSTDATSQLFYINSRRLSGIRRAVSQVEFGGQDPLSLEKASGWLRQRS